ncbi:PTS sugar transporter subunit IIB [Virgibacillus proomii]|jgi:ascorbate PTS system EIIB component|uniref:PTS sugar transporter subunit IIB n=1 Tax=Virgibacillus proomii TaxID=84407 RepID=UPI0009866D78|nr:PTS sugar transporter subunit IIB [Virgibacillus proomii]
MEIITVCGMGFGTSLMLKMTVDEILEQVGIKAEVSALDAGSAKGRNADLIITSADLESALEGVEANKIFIDNLTDADEVKQKLLHYLNKVSK